MSFCDGSVCVARPTMCLRGPLDILCTPTCKLQQIQTVHVMLHSQWDFQVAPRPEPTRSHSPESARPHAFFSRCTTTLNSPKTSGCSRTRASYVPTVLMSGSSTSRLSSSRPVCCAIAATISAGVTLRGAQTSGEYQACACAAPPWTQCSSGTQCVRKTTLMHAIDMLSEVKPFIMFSRLVSVMNIHACKALCMRPHNRDAPACKLMKHENLA